MSDDFRGFDRTKEKPAIQIKARDNWRDVLDLVAGGCAKEHAEGGLIIERPGQAPKWLKPDGSIVELDCSNV